MLLLCRFSDKHGRARLLPSRSAAGREARPPTSSLYSSRHAGGMREEIVAFAEMYQLVCRSLVKIKIAIGIITIDFNIARAQIMRTNDRRFIRPGDIRVVNRLLMRRIARHIKVEQYNRPWRNS